MTPINMLTTLFVMAAVMLAVTHGHGRMLDPVSRMSAYLLGFPTPVNYNDHEMFCGGRAGWHEFRVCNIETSGGIEATHECLNQNLLTDSTGKSRFYLDSSNTGFYNYTLVLPAGLTCSHCLLQWKWHCGNDWNCDESGVCGLGYGPQEEFYACSDVTIAPRNGTGFLPTTSTTRFSSSGTSTTLTSFNSSSATATSDTTTLPASSDSSSSIASEESTTTSASTTSTATTRLSSTNAATTKLNEVTSTAKALPNDTTKSVFPGFWSDIIKMSANITSSSSTTKINYNDPEYIKMLLGYPNTYNPYNASTTPTNPIIKLPLVQMAPTNQLSKDRVCAVCYFGCQVNGCSTTCPEICLRKMTG